MKRLSIIFVEVLLTLVVMYLSGQTPIEIPGLNLPITLQSMVAILMPLVINRRNAAGGILLYLVLAALGLPVLATGVGGYKYFLSESGGYLVGFYLIALTTAFLKPMIRRPRFLYVFGIFMLQHLFLSICGIVWIWAYATGSVSFETHISPFLPGIIVKSFIGVLLVEAITQVKAFFLNKDQKG